MSKTHRFHFTGLNFLGLNLLGLNFQGLSFRGLNYLVLALSITLLSACTELPYSNLNNDQLKTMLEQSVPIYDIRRAEEWRQTGVIENSQLLTFVDAGGRMKENFIASFTGAVGKDDPVILICRTGNRTSALARYLTKKLGYTKVYNVHNGITQWISDKRQVKHL